MATTFLQLKEYARDIGYDDDTSRGVRALESLVNDVFSELHQWRNWPFLKNRLNHRLVAPYSTGTVSINHGSTTLTGSGTTWLSTHVGGFCRFGAVDDVYEVTAFTSTTSVTITPAYTHPAGTDLSAGTYEFVFPAYSHPADFRQLTKPVQGDWFFGLRRISEEEWLSFMASSQLSSGTPTHYADTGDQILFWPPPADQGIITSWYYYLPTALTVDTDNIDWPDSLMHLIRSGIQVKVGKKDLGEYEREKRIAFASFIPSIQPGEKEPEGGQGWGQGPFWMPISSVTS